MRALTLFKSDNTRGMDLEVEISRQDRGFTDDESVVVKLRAKLSWRVMVSDATPDTRLFGTVRLYHCCISLKSTELIR
ncbi:hypothetical protein KGM_208026 [Danaus plexippus plexippus]|uniref:Uncharacterized protein n=1 Tax=Danaus plexippus plexippus TaxID=278856 RepID=A0A212ETB4_DANPL|nr:hypothetical protein KGM_208026 [Danaus plexippus plexippus]